MKIKNFLITLGACLLVSACAAPQIVQDEASKTLVGKCKDLFLNSSLGGYQHVVAQISGKAVFALGVDPQTGAQRCAVGRSNTDVGSQAFGLAGNAVSWEQLEAIATTRCESGSTIKCKVFARNNEIVWNKSSVNKVDFK